MDDATLKKWVEEAARTDGNMWANRFLVAVERTRLVARERALGEAYADTVDTCRVAETEREHALLDGLASRIKARSQAPDATDTKKRTES